MEDFDGNAFATHVEGEAPVTARDSESIKVYQPGVEVAWSTTSQLCEAVVSDPGGVAGVIATTSGGRGQQRGGSWIPSRQLHHPLEATGGWNCAS
jgi:hypothetical protein